MRLTPMTDSQTDNECFKSSKENLGFQLNMSKFNPKQYLKEKLCNNKWFKVTKKKLSIKPNVVLIMLRNVDERDVHQS